tara:strand:- start:439 stop:837 length:399 start_codon:yes stop_codon:yes gene_type:complete
MRQRITVELTTTSSTDDIFAALALLKPDDLKISTKRLDCKQKSVRGPYRKRRSPSKERYARPRHYKNLRLVWDGEAGHINVRATLHNLGLTPDGLLAKKTKAGTVECVTKHAMVRQKPGDYRGLASGLPEIQ